MEKRCLLAIITAVTMLLVWLSPVTARAQTPAAPKRVALVISNAAYTSAGVLANPPNDARIIATALREVGFQTIDAQSNLRRDGFQAALRSFQRLAAGAQVAMIYYAGHGIEGNGRNWLIPTDATLASERDLDYEAINLDLVLAASDGADLRIVILDACRNNPFGRTWRRGARTLARGLTGIEADDVLVVYAAAPGATAADGDGANSPFAAALARRLVQRDLPVQLLGGAVRDDVLRATSGVQRPYISASITGTPFYFREPSATPRSQPEIAPETAGVFRDCDACPTLVTVPAGQFTMGSPTREIGRVANEGPQRTVSVDAFAIGRSEVTFDDWAACVAGGGCRTRATPRDFGFGRGSRPVIDISWYDAQEYVAWLSQKTRRVYRLPSEAEWEYAARAGSQTPHPWAGDAGAACAWANIADASLRREDRAAVTVSCDDGVGRRTSAVDRYRPNAFGLNDMIGNVWEWTADCYADSFAERGETAVAHQQASCAFRVARGGAFNSAPRYLRVAYRARHAPASRNQAIGFRVVRAL